MSFSFKNSGMPDLALTGEFGIEKECMRTTAEGFMSHERHPFGRSRYFQRDFCENQVEFVTDALDSPQKVCAQLYELHSLACYTLDKSRTRGELLWPFSNPPYVKGEEDIPVADFYGSRRSKTRYRQYLADKYGKMQMLYSGIHLNYSFSPRLLQAAYEASGEKSLAVYKNNAYLELAKKLTACAWLIVYLTAASPVADGSLFDKGRLGETAVTRYSSIRCGEAGYWNSFIPVLDYSDLASYTQSVQKYIDSGSLMSLSELYYPVRLKPIGANSAENLLRSGVNHIELRMLDINPFSPTGVMEEDIEFVRLLVAYLMAQEDFTFDEAMQSRAIDNEKTAALLDCGDKRLSGTDKTVGNQALEILDGMEKFYSCTDNENIFRILRYQKEKITVPGRSYARRVIESFGRDYVRGGLRLAGEYAAAFKSCKQKGE